MQTKINFESENIDVDWISFKFNLLETKMQKSLVNYLFKLGFNSYVQSGKLLKAEKENLKVSPENNFSVLFVKEGPYWEGSLLHFSGKNANQFYQYAKTNSIDWNLFSNSVLSRLDLCYICDLPVNEDDVKEFFDACHTKLKLNVNYEINRKGQMLKFGNRRSNRFSRIYIDKNRLKFEHEIKGSLIEQYSEYLMTNSLDEFEFLLSQYFFHYFGNQLLSVDSIYLTWLAKKIRSLQPKPLSNLTFQTDYFETSIQVNKQKRLVQFLKFLNYVRDLDYRWEFLGTTRYRVVSFRLNDFLKFLHGPDCTSRYKFNQLQDFCNELQKDFFVTLFNDENFQSLVSVPKVEIHKEVYWIGKFWIVDDLFYYNYPFSFPDMFNSDLSKYEFAVLFEIFKCFNSPTIEKRIDIKKFIDGFPSKLSNQTSRKLKLLFLEPIQILENNGVIESRFKVFRDGKLEPVKKLTIDNISEGFVIYEKLNFFQLPDLS